MIGDQTLGESENDPSALEVVRGIVYVLFAGLKSPTPRVVPPRYPLPFIPNFVEVLVKTI